MCNFEFHRKCLRPFKKKIVIILFLFFQRGVVWRARKSQRFNLVDCTRVGGLLAALWKSARNTMETCETSCIWSRVASPALSSVRASVSREYSLSSGSVWTGQLNGTLLTWRGNIPRGVAFYVLLSTRLGWQRRRGTSPIFVRDSVSTFHQKFHDIRSSA